MSFLKWLIAGLGLKRWLLLGASGIGMYSMGLVALIRPAQTLALLGLPVFSTSLFWSMGTGAVLAVGGLFMLAYAFYSAIHDMARVLRPGEQNGLADLARNRLLRRGPRVVVIGGGTGLHALLRGLKKYTSNITAVVTVADDGGSSGRIRREIGIPAPGDIRNNLVALADTEPLMEKLFQYRFDWGEGLKGHCFGNLFIAAMTEITGDFEAAIKLSSRVLSVRGQVLPSTTTPVKLEAEMEDGARIEGESRISASPRAIRRIRLIPPEAHPCSEVLEAIRKADIIVLGPGSLYTSVMPNLLVDGIAEEIRCSQAVKIYVCNVMTQPGETEGYKAQDHVTAIERHVGRGLFTYVLMNRSAVKGHSLARYAAQGSAPVMADETAIAEMGYVPVSRELLASTDVVRHDPDKLAIAILSLAAASQGARNGSFSQSLLKRSLLGLYLHAPEGEGGAASGRTL